jgi:hypothetical protein
MPLGLNYTSYGSFMFPKGQVHAPLKRACPSLFVRAPPPMRARPSLCVRALGSFKPLEAHICPLGA